MRRPLIRCLLLGLAACAPDRGGEADDTGRGAGGKADDVAPPRACAEVFDGRQGFSRKLVDPTMLKDPIAQFVLRAEGSCPRTAADVMEVLAMRDGVDCALPTGTGTAVVSETAQVTGVADGFRAITIRDCGGRPEHGLAISMANLHGDSTRVPDDAEFMAFDPTLGSFSFYTLQGGVWTFHGTSQDLVTPGTQSRCAQCHADGGMIMKELDTPWVHWEGDATTPGAATLIDAIDDLGTRRTGSDLEQTVLAANREWTEIWLKNLLLEGDLERVLAPLFCTHEFNLGTAAKAVDDPVRFVPAEALVDDVFDAGAFPLQINVTPASYDAAIAAGGQRVQRGGKALRRPDGSAAIDTHFKLAFVQRARADQQFVERLQQVGVIDREFAMDVLAIDFTRPVFSAERCALLEFVPALPKLATGQPDGAAAVKQKFAELIGDCCVPHDGGGCSGEAVQACVCAQDEFCCTDEWDGLCVNLVSERGCAACPGREGEFANPEVDLVASLPERIRAGFIANLKAAAPPPESAAGQLLANLQSDGGTQTHPQRVAEFFAACNARPDDERIRDVLAVISARRTEARNSPLIEHEATLPVDDLEVPLGTSLDPVTCTLVEP